MPEFCGEPRVCFFSTPYLIYIQGDVKSAGNRVTSRVPSSAPLAAKQDIRWPYSTDVALDYRCGQSDKS